MKAVIKNNLKLPDMRGVNFQEDLKWIADKIVIKTLQHNIDKEQSLQEKKFPPLADATIEIKRRQGLSTKVLTATSLLRNSFKAKKRGRNTVVVDIASDRKVIAKKLQFTGVRSQQYGLRKWNFFGISTRMEKEAVKYMKSKIEELVKSARRGKT